MVGFTTLALSALLSSLATSSPISSPSSLLPTKRQITCVPSNGLYILVARGSNQPVGEGSVGPVANLIEDRLAGSYSHAIDYPATIISFESNYFSSVEDGIEDTKKSIEEYVAACGEDARIALIGYSQGGNVMTDTLAGGTGKPAPIAESYRKNSKLIFTPFFSGLWSYLAYGINRYTTSLRDRWAFGEVGRCLRWRGPAYWY